jgi:transcriptional regulator with XRE-family HTH domain
MEHQGVVLRKLRLLNGFSVKQASKKVGRGVGWISEVENGRGSSRLTPAEFERVVAIYAGEKYRKQFSLWIANAHKATRGDEKMSFDGAVLKYVRTKAGLSLMEAAKELELDKGNLSRIEHGIYPVSSDLRDRMMRVYGYSPASFKNFASEDKRAKSVPVMFKLEILLNRMSDKAIEALFFSAVQIHQQFKEI